MAKPGPLLRILREKRVGWGGIIISPSACCLPVLSKEEIIYQPFLSGAQRVLVIM